MNNQLNQRVLLLHLTFLIFCSGVSAQSDSASEKALSVQPRHDHGLTDAPDSVAVDTRTNDEQFMKTAKTGFDGFRYKPLQSTNWAESMSLAFSQDGRYLCIGEHNIEWRDPVNGVAAGEVGRRREPAKTLAISRLWDLDSGREVRRFAGHPKEFYIQSVSFSDDAKLVSSTSFMPYHSRIFVRAIPNGEDVRIWDRASGEELFHWKDAGVKAAISPDASVVATLGSGHVSFYSTAGRSEHPLRSTGFDAYLDSVPVFINEGRRLLASEGDGLVEIDVATAGILRRIGTSIHRGPISHFTVNRDSSLLATVMSDEFWGPAIVLWDLKKGTEIRRFSVKQDQGEPMYVGFTENDYSIRYLTGRNNFSEWELETGNQIRDAEFQQRGYPKAIATIGRFAAVAQSGLGVVDLMDLKTGEPLLRLHNFHPDRQWLVEAADGTFECSDDLFAIEGSRFESMKMRRDPQSIRNICHRISGLNVVRDVVPEQAGSGQRLFVLTIGVSEHKYPEYNLRYAARDAERLAEELKLNQNGLFKDVFVQIYTNEDANQKNIQDGLDWLQRSCTKEDVAVVLFSGHGVRGRNGLYFVPFEGDDQGIQSTCLNWTSVADRVARTNAAQILFFADCCHAGAFSKETRPTQDEIAQAFARKQDLFFFCSSQGDEVSIETEELEHGAFTAAVIDAWSGAADADNDQFVTCNELATYVRTRVRDQTGDRQTPYVPYPDLYKPQFLIHGSNIAK